MSKTSKPPNEKLLDYINIYLDSVRSNHAAGDELEVRFGTKFWNPTTQIDFNNVISKLKSQGFNADVSEGSYRLTIMNQYIDRRSGGMKISNIRTEVAGIGAIQDYCKSNSFDTESIPRNITFNQKRSKHWKGEFLKAIDFDDFQFRVNYKEEKYLRPNFGLVQGMLSKWEASRKIFRFIKRFSFAHPKFPFTIDCSIVQTSSRNAKHYMIPEYRIESSNVFNNPISYEIEIEILKHRLPKDATAESIVKQLKRVIMMIMSGLQNSNFPIKYSVQEEIAAEYMNLLWKKNKPERRIRSSDFVGPSSISLELVNVSPIDEDSKIPNIRMPYTTTDKADGVRKLMFINKKGTIYLIDVNMNIQFTGVLCRNRDYYNTIIDGEHILHNKLGIFINQFWAFDIYYKNKIDLRPQPFTKIEGIDAPADSKFRLTELDKAIKNLVLKPVVGEKLSMNFHVKTFYISNGPEIFKNCQLIIERERQGLFSYEIDGMIFTPADKGVGSDKVGETLPPMKKTWRRSFKWKPPEFNTIDFLVTTKKTAAGKEFIGNIFQDGDNMNNLNQITQYKTLILRVGFDERKHGYINPCEDVINDRLPTRQHKDSNDAYKPVPFQPTDPTPAYPAYIANIVLKEVDGVKYMYTEDMKSVIEDETIVEFKYNQNDKKFWEWTPIRVRTKKTAEYKAGRRNYGNAYHVAQSIWKSIHNPVTEDMITTGNDIPDQIVDDDVYYNRSGSTITKALRDFHNLFVKRSLILGATSQGGTLIDMSVGKGGDFPKWIAAKLAFVLGLDIARDNIENRLDGACARFLNYRKKFYSMPYALFINANSGLNIRSGEACYTEKGKEIVKAVFGEGAQDEGKLGKGVIRQFGKAKAGFDVVSNQFSLHYFFENTTILASFLQNISECCKVGGYFIGTSYDGGKVFQLLEAKKAGEGIHITKNGKKMWEIKKQYENIRFENNKSSVGYRIDVYQESINKIFPEYLVNYDYLVTVMEDFGFVLLSREEAKTMGLPNSMGNFNELFDIMEDEISARRLKKSDVGRALAMSPDEKKISFLNKYFIFKKVRDVNAAQVARVLSDESVKQELSDIRDSFKLQKTIMEEQHRPKSKIKKLARKLTLTQNPKHEKGSVITLSSKRKIKTKSKPKGEHNKK